MTLLGSPTASEYTDTTAVKGVLYSYSVGTSATRRGRQRLRRPGVERRRHAPASDAAAEGQLPGPGRHHARRLRRRLRPRLQQRARLRLGAPRHPGAAQPRRQRPHPDRRRDVGSAPEHDDPRAVPVLGSDQTNGVHRQGAWQMAWPRAATTSRSRWARPQPGSDPTRNVVNLEGTNAVDYTTVTAARHRQHRRRPLQDGDDQRAGHRRFPDPGHRGRHQHEAHPPVGHPGHARSTRSPSSRPASPPPPGTARSPSTGPTTPRTRTTSRATTSTAARPRPVATTGTPLERAPLTDSATPTPRRRTTRPTTTSSSPSTTPARSRPPRRAASATPDASGSPRARSLPLKMNFVAGHHRRRRRLRQGLRPGLLQHPWLRLGQPHHGAPLNLVGNGRFRDVRAGVAVDIRQRGLMHMQGDDVPPTSTGSRPRASGRSPSPTAATTSPSASATSPVRPLRRARRPATTASTASTSRASQAIDQFQATAGDEFETATVGRPGHRRPAHDRRRRRHQHQDQLRRRRGRRPRRPGSTGRREATPGDGQNTLEWDANAESDSSATASTRPPTRTCSSSAANRLSPATPQTGRSFTHDDLTNGTVYRYVVTAVDHAGNESIASATVDATPQDRTAPAARVGALHATAGDAFVALAWTASTSSDIASYRIYRSETTPVGAPIAAAGEVTHPAHGVHRHDGGERHAVPLRRRRRGRLGQRSAPTDSASATPEDVVAPPAPVGRQRRPGRREGHAHVGRRPGQRRRRPSGSTATPTPGVATDRRPTCSPPRPLEDGTTYVDDDVDNGTTYYYKITAVDEADNESEASTQVSATPVPDPDTHRARRPDRRHRHRRRRARHRQLGRGHRVRRPARLPRLPLRHAGRHRHPGQRREPGHRRCSSSTPASSTAATYYYRVTSLDTTGNESARSAENSATPADRHRARSAHRCDGNRAASTRSP